MVPNLPGFYYDRERRRYFRISENRGVLTTETTSRYIKDNIKRQCVQAGYDKQLSVINKKRQQVLEKYKINVLNPLERAFRPLPYGKYVVGLSLQHALLSRNQNCNTHVSVTTELFNVPHRTQIGILANHILLATQEGSFQDKIAFSTSKGYVAGFSSLSNCSEEKFFISFSMIKFNSVLKHKSEPTDVFKTMKLERTIATKEGPSKYLYHNINTRTNVHTFVTLSQDTSSLKVLKVRQVKFKDNDRVHDSLVAGDTLVITVNDCCRFYNLIPESLPRPFLFFPDKSSREPKRRSDITSLSFCLRQDTPLPLKTLNSAVFYVGFRNGHSVAIVLNNTKNMTLLQCFKAEQRTLEKQLRPIRTTLKSIVSIKTLNNKGSILISGMLDKENTQKLIMADIFLEDALTKEPVVSFKTKFLNVTKEKEIFEVSDDGCYFIYGSTSARNGRGDFEVFCTILSRNLDYEKSKNGNITLYPIRAMRDYCGPEGFQSEFIYLHSILMPPKNVKMGGATRTSGREATASFHDIFEEALSQKIYFLTRREDSPYNGANIFSTSTLA